MCCRMGCCPTGDGASQINRVRRGLGRPLASVLYRVARMFWVAYGERMGSNSDQVNPIVLTAGSQLTMIGPLATRPILWLCRR